MELQQDDSEAFPVITITNNYLIYIVVSIKSMMISYKYRIYPKQGYRAEAS